MASYRWLLAAVIALVTASFAWADAPGWGVIEAAIAEIPDAEPAVAEIPPRKTEATVRDAKTRGLTQAMMGRNPFRVREQVDPDDNVERVLLLAPGGPIVIQVSILLDGQPFRRHREKLVDAVLQSATASDGSVTWEQAFASPRFAFGRFAGFGQQNADQRRALLRQYDLNGDGMMDRFEARSLVAQIGGGGEFQVPSFFGGGQFPNVAALLDADGDGVISEQEIAAAPERLKSRDANDNDLLEANEISAGAARNPGPVTYYTNGDQAAVALPLGPAANFPAIRASLRERYRKDGKLTAASFPLFPRLLDGIDTNANGEIDEDEIPNFNTIRPHVALKVNLGEVPGVPQGISMTHLAPEFAPASMPSEFGSQAVVILPGIRLSMSVPNQPGAQVSYRASAVNTVAQFDTDKNGYLDKKEIEGSPNKQYLMMQFDRWDENGDGKVYPEEIEADFERQQAPQRSQVSFTAGNRGSSLFGMLDTSGDGRLSLREMRTAAARIKELDINGDGRLSPDEAPAEIAVSMGRGNNGGYAFGGGGLVRSLGGMPAASPSRGESNPKWFQHMDRNGDGDLTPREFLGTAEKFRELDTNGDGFIEPAEARAAGGKAKDAPEK